MKKLSYMSMDQASQILDYGKVPKTREEQVGLISILGYSKVRGVKSLSKAPDCQVRQVAQKLFHDAERTVNQYWRALEEEERQEAENVFPAQYHTFLCDRFEIPESERGNYTISQLEEQLQQ